MAGITRRTILLAQAGGLSFFIFFMQQEAFTEFFEALISGHVFFVFDQIV